jgi:hypothetical protein
MPFRHHDRIPVSMQDDERIPGTGYKPVPVFYLSVVHTAILPEASAMIFSFI